MHLIELLSNSNEKRTVVADDISSYSEETFYNNGTDFIHYTKITLKNGHEVMANKDAYDYIKKQFDFLSKRPQ